MKSCFALIESPLIQLGYSQGLQGALDLAMKEGSVPHTSVFYHVVSKLQERVALRYCNTPDRQTC